MFGQGSKRREKNYIIKSGQKVSFTSEITKEAGKYGRDSESETKMSSGGPKSKSRET